MFPPCPAGNRLAPGCGSSAATASHSSERARGIPRCHGRTRRRDPGTGITSSFLEVRDLAAVAAIASARSRCATLNRDHVYCAMHPVRECPQAGRVPADDGVASPQRALGHRRVHRARVLGVTRVRRAAAEQRPGRLGRSLVERVDLAAAQQPAEVGLPRGPLDLDEDTSRHHRPDTAHQRSLMDEPHPALAAFRGDERSRVVGESAHWSRPTPCSSSMASASACSSGVNSPFSRSHS